ncbi:MAG: FAD-dependent oxidoreductase [Candidatus Omnitrophica bacterium]|nr:FAD-dependent oxidoreductase [Candidatus Omnitrophota bacterium]MDD5487582.1 FAD-dependent oxidoreductase [Candidatus Omnitrophota bacterium]
MTELDTRVIETIQRTDTAKSFRFDRTGAPDFRPGQYFLLTIPVGGEEKTKAFSFSSSPTEQGYLEFTKRLTGSDFSNALMELKPGDPVKIKMPNGKFTFEGEHKKIALLSGGIGITPFRSICKYATDKELESDIALFYSNNEEKDIVFREDLDGMAAQNPHLKLIYTLTSPYAAEKEWRGCTGVIDEGMIKREVPDYAERIFYTCGPPGMVTCLTGMLREKLHIPEEHTIIENFAGY